MKARNKPVPPRKLSEDHRMSIKQEKSSKYPTELPDRPVSKQKKKIPPELTEDHLVSIKQERSSTPETA